MFTVYLEKPLRDLRNQLPTHQDDDEISALRNEIQYADDCDFITTNKDHNNIIIEAATKTLKYHNLLINNSKTEYTSIKRGNRDRKSGAVPRN